MSDRALRRSLEASLRRTGATHEEAEEAVNDAFAAEAVYDGEIASRASFLYTIARRRWVTQVRQETRGRVRPHGDLSGLAELPSSPDLAEAVVDRIAMAELLETLAPRERDGLLLRADGYPTADAAERLGMSAAAYRKMVSRAIPRLRGAWQAAARAIWLPVAVGLRRAQNRLNVTAETGSLVAASTLTAVAVAVAVVTLPAAPPDGTGLAHPMPEAMPMAPLAPPARPLTAPVRTPDSSAAMPSMDEVLDDEPDTWRRPRVRINVEPTDGDPSPRARVVRPEPVPETELNVQLTCGDLGIVGELVCGDSPAPTVPSLQPATH
ncbi:MAG: sigma-70 family RNA polymerase sigma factor [Nitriliruptorales bacterium]|nr:sigma-70 family RNA polymerase sigma factor [Nitriliruptorales bacterium]